MNEMTDVQIAWVSGIFEGEGTFGIGTVKTKNGSIYNQVYTAVHMTDEDVIKKLYDFTGIGNMRSLTERPNTKQAYMWKVSVRKDVEDLIFAMLPHLGQRRTARALEGLAVINVLKNLQADRKVPVCQYSNCKKDLSNKGPAALYCSDSHKSMAYQMRVKNKELN